MDYLSTFPEQPPRQLDPQVAADLSARAGVTPFYRLSAQEGRAAFEALRAAAPKLNDPVVRVENHVIPGPGGEIAVRVYSPVGQGPFPSLLYIHGGGWVIGSLDSHDD